MYFHFTAYVSLSLVHVCCVVILERLYQGQMSGQVLFFENMSVHFEQLLLISHLQHIGPHDDMHFIRIFVLSLYLGIAC